MASVEERFHSSYAIENRTGCWNWLRYKLPKGYGTFMHVNPKVSELAHRLSWRLHNKEIPEGLLICHRCDNPSCVNPEHLFLGTYSDNMRDAISKGRWHGRNYQVTHCKFGHQFTNENTRITSAGSRRCILCSRAYDNEWKKNKRKELSEVTHG